MARPKLSTNPKTVYDRLRYKRKRAELVKLMGGKCQKCGSKHKLEFHHKYKRTWVCRDLSRWSRLARYRKEYEEKKLELLCNPCNCSAGQPTEEEPSPDPDFYVPPEGDF